MLEKFKNKNMENQITKRMMDIVDSVTDERHAFRGCMLRFAAK